MCLSPLTHIPLSHLVTYSTQALHVVQLPPLHTCLGITPEAGDIYKYS